MPSSAPTASSSVRIPPLGKSFGCASAYDSSELSFGPNVSPLPSGVSMRSRGIEIRLTVCPTGSSEATIIVSVRVSVRVRVESTPTSRTFSRSPSPGPGSAAGSAPPSVELVKIRPNVSPMTVP